MQSQLGNGDFKEVAPMLSGENFSKGETWCEKAQKNPEDEKQSLQNYQKGHLNKFKLISVAEKTNGRYSTEITLFLQLDVCASWVCVYFDYRTLTITNASLTQNSHGAMWHHPRSGTITD